MDNTIRNKETFEVVGRYMDGTEVVGYHVVSSSGKEGKMSREKLILYVGKGLVTNCRTQSSDSSGIILRGKGINLKTLKIYDVNKKEFREREATQVGNTYKAIACLQKNGSIIGFKVVDPFNNEMTLSAQKVQTLIAKGAIKNINANFSNISGLPVISVGQSEKRVILGPRTIYLKNSGVIYDKATNKRVRFNGGEYVLIGENGNISKVSAKELKNNYEIKEGTRGACDDNIEYVRNYEISFDDGNKLTLAPSVVLQWHVIADKQRA